MRLVLLVILSTCFSMVSQVGAVEQFPYKAYVATDNVYVRSGPGSNYYPTVKLKAGQEVEVYRHDPGGWFAIRPPKGSFTWVSSRYVKPTGNGLAEVTGDQVAARVGSQFSDIREVVAVRLHRGEPVELLDEDPILGSTGKPRWYKITPPSGEFRWISGRFVDPNYPRDGLRKSSIGGSPMIQQNRTRVQNPAQVQQVTAETGLSQPTGLAASRPMASGIRVAQHSAPAGSVPVGFTSSREEVPYDGEAASIAIPERATRSLSLKEYEEKLSDLDIELSIMVAEEPTVWSFDKLAMQANALLVRAETALERGRARVLVNKIARFQDIKKRSDAVNKVYDETQRHNRQLAQLGRQRANAGKSSTVPSSGTTPFDGHGRLIQTPDLGKPGSPRYALIDKRGDIRCYVTAAPDVNLHYYLNRQVGINGDIGYLPELRTRHVIARHITPIPSRVRR